MADFSPYQQKIIKRYYNNFDSIQHQRLSEMIGDLYLSEGKKLERVWKNIGELLTRMEFPPARIVHLLEKRDPKLLPGVLKELEAKE